MAQEDALPAVCMFVYNNCLSDQRVLKEARTVAQAGHRVTIVAVLDKRSTPIEEHPDFTIIRIERDPLHYKLLRRTRQARRRMRVRRARMRLMWRRRTAGGRRFWRKQRLALRRRIAFLRRRTAGGRRFWHKQRLAVGRRIAFLRRARRDGPVLDAQLSDDEQLSPSRSRAGYGVLAVVGAPVMAYRALRWRVLRRVPMLRRRYARRAPTSSLALRRARARARRRLRVDPEGTQPELRRLLAPNLRGLVPRLAPARAVRAVDRGVSAAAYRSLMAFHRPLMFTDYYRRAFRAVVDEGYVVFQAHDVITLPVAAWAARKTGARLVYDSHELYSEVSTLSPRERRIWARIEGRLIRRADRVMTVCESIADELVQRYSVPKPVVLLNCPARSAAPANLTDLGRLRARAELEPGEPIVLYQGGYTPNRGIEELIDSVRYLERGVLVLMGWGTIEDGLRARIRKAGLSERIRMIPPAAPDELLEFTVGADVGVIPYKAVGLNNYYTTPNKLFEYIAAGLPVAGSRFPELRRVIEGENIGLTFDPEDPRDIGLALNYLLADTARLDELRANTRAAAPRYVWEIESVKLLDVYSEVTAIGAGTALPARRR
jgi:glycosyltransferase involved in cell wall biosynthesis